MKIDIDLSASSFLNAAAELRKYADSLQGKAEQLVQKLGDKGVEMATMHYLDVPYDSKHVDTGETLNSIQFNREGSTGTVSAGGAAVWIEFGTGVVRNGGGGHPKKGEFGMSDWGTYGQGHGADPNGWWYPSRDGYSHTWGIEMNPFMYSTSQDIRRYLRRTAKEVFKSD